MSNTVAYARESFAGCIDEALPLLAKHHAEIDSYPDIPLDVDRERYAAVEAAGGLRVYTARCEGLLLGYAVFCVSRNAHSRDSLQAVQDAVYLDPDYRRGDIGISLLRYAERQMAAEGVELLHHYVKRRHPMLGRILARLGYEHTESTFSKRLNARG
jgi:GNAT superfamily N-acetyltransferase